MYQSPNGGDPLSLQCRQPEALQLECFTEQGRGLQTEQPCPQINRARRDGCSTPAQLSNAARCSAHSGCSPQEHPVPTARLLVLPLHFSCSNVSFSSLGFVCLVGWFLCNSSSGTFPLLAGRCWAFGCMGEALLLSTPLSLKSMAHPLFSLR